MWNPPTKKQLAKLPLLYSTENVPIDEKIVHMHFFIGACDWYVFEYDPENRLFYGWACLGDRQNAEAGYFSLDEMLEASVGPGIEIDRELHWRPRPFGEIWNKKEAA